MTTTFRSELLKLRTTRSTVAIALGGVGLAAFLGFVTAAFAGKEGAAPLGSAGMVDNVVGVSTIPAALGLLLGILLSAGEHQHRTIATTFLVTPRRDRVVAAKVAAAAVAAAALAAVMVLAAIVGAAPRTLAEGADVELASSSVGTVVGLLLASALLAVVGVLLGHLLRSQVAAVVVVLLWFTVLEAIADTMTGGALRDWLPGAAAATLAGGGDDGVWRAGLLLATWAAAFGAITVPVVVRRDVT